MQTPSYSGAATSKARLRTWISILAVGAVAWAAFASCGKRDRVSPPTDDLTPIQLVDRGWDKFESGDLDGALVDFTQAAADSATYADAHLGLGWTRLGRALSSNDMAAAAAELTTAENLGAPSADVKAGRACASLGQGSQGFASAIADAQAARAASPSFVFSHRGSFDVIDLRLVEAKALAGQASYANALTVANQISPSGIQEGSPSTYLVDGVTLPSFATAVLAYLQKLSNQHAG